MELAVVQITATRYRVADPLVATTQGLPRERRSAGSGVFVSSSGHIVTNAHVVDNSRRILDASFAGDALQPGDVIYEINRREIKNMDQLRAALSS